MGHLIDDDTADRWQHNYALAEDIPRSALDAVGLGDLSYTFLYRLQKAHDSSIPGNVDDFKARMTNVAREFNLTIPTLA